MEAMLERLVVAVEGGHGAVPVAPRFPARAVDVQAQPTEIAIRSEKGEAFWDLLAGDDVAIEVVRDGDRIVVFGSERDRMLAEAFAAMVTSDEKTYRRMDIAPQHVDAVWEFMSRRDVPVWVRRDDGGISVEGTPLQHLVFESFARAMVGDGGDPSTVPAGREPAQALRRRAPGRAVGIAPIAEADQREIERLMAQVARQQAAEAAGLARREVMQAMAEQQVRAEHQIAVAQLRLAMNQMDVEMTEAESRRARIEMEAAELDRRAAELEQHEERIRSEWENAERAIDVIEIEIDRAIEAGGEGSREQVRSLRRKMREVQRRMDELEREADRLERERDELQRVEEELEEAADALEEQADELAEAREELMDRLADMERELVERLERGDDVLPGMIEEPSDDCDSACEAEAEAEADCTASRQ
jgi:predicted  nucleic acid-binding Zn-ribbon protein